MTLRFLAMRASGFVPVLMSLAAVALLALALGTGFGTSSDGDEGTAAHLWQLLMAGQLPVIGYFAVRYATQAPREGAIVLTAQIGAVCAAAAPVFLLHL